MEAGTLNCSSLMEGQNRRLRILVSIARFWNSVGLGRCLVGGRF